MPCTYLARKEQKLFKVWFVWSSRYQIQKHTGKGVWQTHLQISTGKQRRWGFTRATANTGSPKVRPGHWCQILRVCQVERLHCTQWKLGNLQQGPQLTARPGSEQQRLQGQFKPERIPQVIQRVHVLHQWVCAWYHRACVEYHQAVSFQLHHSKWYCWHIQEFALQYRHRHC